MKNITFFSILVSSFISSQSLEEVISGNHRSEENKSRDQYRNPIETLNFFGFKR